VTHGGSSIPEVRRLLSVLATGRRAGEAGTAFGEGAEAIAMTAQSVVTVERDPDRAATASERLGSLANVEFLVGDWRDLLPPRGPFDLLFHDAGDFKRAPYEHGELVVSLLAHGGLLVLDDMTPGWSGQDPVREWAHGQQELRATEVLMTPETSVLVVARL
jgi:predicted O-methyltransferase YrrM